VVAKILVVEDDIHLMEGIREILELDNYEVMTAPTGLDGLDVLRALPAPPDLIVSDIMMPRMDGYQFFEAVRAEKQWISVPFIFLTAKGEKADIRYGKAMGADDYVTKPFSADDLLVAVSSKLARHGQLQSVFSQQVNEMKRRILTILNHEFRTPLTYVVAYADMLDRDADHLMLHEMKEFLRGVNAGADRLRRLVENFILLVEIETGEATMTCHWRRKLIKDYQRVISQALRHQQGIFDQHEQTLEIHIAPDAKPIMADEEYLSAALARLLDNASKFSGQGARIEFRVQNDETGAPCLSVRDYGRGIPANEHEKIFESFYQIKREKYEDQGAGSGLAIVKGLTLAQGAEMLLESVEGEGSLFTMRFRPA
jgi:two-component system sensor kinase